MNFEYLLPLFFYLLASFLVGLAEHPKTNSFIKSFIRPLLPVLKFIRHQFVILLPYFFVITFLTTFYLVQQISNWWCFWYVISTIAVSPFFLSKEESNPARMLLKYYEEWNND